MQQSSLWGMALVFLDEPVHAVSVFAGSTQAAVLNQA